MAKTVAALPSRATPKPPARAEDRCGGPRLERQAAALPKRSIGTIDAISGADRHIEHTAKSGEEETGIDERQWALELGQEREASGKMAIRLTAAAAHLR